MKCALICLKEKSVLGFVEEGLCPHDFSFYGYYSNGECTAQKLLYRSHDTCIKCWTEDPELGFVLEE